MTNDQWQQDKIGRHFFNVVYSNNNLQLTLYGFLGSYTQCVTLIIGFRHNIYSYTQCVTLIIGFKHNIYSYTQCVTLIIGFRHNIYGFGEAASKLLKAYQISIYFCVIQTGIIQFRYVVERDRLFIYKYYGCGIFGTFNAFLVGLH